MLISVIITAHSRKEYVLNAVKSVLYQTLSREFYEIIIIKNFEDRKVNEFLVQNGIKMYSQDVANVGSDIGAGIRMSKGDVLCFLDDDDLFEENKLEIVYSIFKENPDLGYYHNSFVTIDSKGSKIEAGLRNPTSRTYVKKEKMFEGLIPRLLRDSAGHNMSCISIRKAALGPFLRNYDEIEIAPDLYLFYMALHSPYPLIIDSSRLTYYRIHNSLSYTYENRLKFIENKKIVFRAHIKTQRQISEVVKRTELEKYSKYSLVEWEFYLAIVDEKTLNSLDFIKFALFLRYLLLRREKNLLLLIVAVLVAKIKPNFVRDVYYNNRRSFLGKFN